MTFIPRSALPFDLEMKSGCEIKLAKDTGFSSVNILPL